MAIIGFFESQQRVAPMGGVFGLDQPAVIAGLTAFGFEPQVAWLFAASWEQGMLQGIRDASPEG